MGEGDSVDVGRPGLRLEGAGRMHRSLALLDAVVRVLLCGPPTLLTLALFPVIFRWPAAVMRASRPWLTPVRQPAKRLASGPVDFLAARVLQDPRDALILHAAIWPSLVLIPSAVVLYMHEFSVAHAVLHLMLVLGPGNVMFQLVFSSLHQVCHRPRGVFKRPWGIFDRYIPWVTGALIGEIPEIENGHVWIHHAHVGSLDDHFDFSGHYDRSSWSDFTRFVLHRKLWFQSGIGLVWAFAVRRKWTLMGRTLLGMAAYGTAVAVLATVSPWATLVVFVLPFFTCLWLIAIATWAQHCFVDGAEPDNRFRQAINVLDPHDMFHEGYHLSHHLKPARHFSEIPTAFSMERLLAEGTVVLEGLNWAEIWLWLMRQRLDVLAEHVVKPGWTLEEKRGLLDERVAPRSTRSAETAEKRHGVRSALAPLEQPSDGMASFLDVQDNSSHISAP
jgi:hypothetical protein